MHRVYLCLLLLSAIVAAGPASAMKLITTYAEDPLVGGKKVETDKINLVPGWGRIAGELPGQMSLNDLQTWVDWAQQMKGEPTLDIIHKVNDKVNKTFKYQIDAVTWGETDYWETPEEAVSVMTIDCEGYSIFKLFLLMAAGADIENPGLTVGQIVSTKEFHAILLVTAENQIYVLDNRSNVVKNTITFSDFKPKYSVDLSNVWVYR
ncbi:MAG: transglutaminase-like cysteine peptidase [Limibacillus sp.]